MANPKDLERALAGDKNLRKADLREADLTGVDLTGARLQRADLRGKGLDYTRGVLNRDSFSATSLSHTTRTLN
jgi:uncharacterized protein YjbI with pentapeptide repeats